MAVRARAPLRIGLAGGGTDLSPYCDRYGGQVLNATIDLYAYTMIEPRRDGRVRFVATDIGVSEEEWAEEAIELRNPLALHKAVYMRIVRQFRNGEPLPCTVTTFCEAPPGSGLGSSSTMVVSMLKAYVELLGLPLGEYDIAQLAFDIERRDLGLAGGRQDQYAATFGGFNFMEFYGGDRVVVNPLRIKNWILSELETRLILFYTGVSRESAHIVDEQASNVSRNSDVSIAAMHQLKTDAMGMKECVLKGDFDGLAAYMRQSWEAKKRTASKVSNAGIDAVVEAALASGASAGKVSGAGGGGFITFLVEPSRRMDVIRTLEGQEGRVMICHFTKHGTQGWRID